MPINDQVLEMLAKADAKTKAQVFAQLTPDERAELGRAMSAPSAMTAAGLGAAQGLTLNFGDEIGGAIQAGLGSVLPESMGGYRSEDKRSLVDRYRDERDSFRQENDAAQKAHGTAYGIGQVAGGLATAALPVSGGAIATGVKLGAAAGLGGSEADLTRGDVVGAAKDTAKGAAIGLAGGAAGAALGKALPAAAAGLQKVGQSRLFKAAVGHNKRAFTLVNGKGMLDKAGQYLDDIGIGVGDSTESIAKKLAARNDAINAADDAMVAALDGAPRATKISPAAVADRIEKEVAAPLKRMAANQDEYAQVMREVESIRGLGDEAMSFAEAVAQRRAVQGKIHYDNINGLTAAAAAKNKIAQIWNNIIDEHAEPILRQMGKDGAAYRALRSESGLIKELLGHSGSRVAGNAANNWASPMSVGIGGAVGAMTHDPYMAAAAFVANHVAKRYGNAAAGRAAIAMARAGSRSAAFAKKLLPSIGRAADRPSVPQPAYAEDDAPPTDTRTARAYP